MSIVFWGGGNQSQGENLLDWIYFQSKSCYYLCCTESLLLASGDLQCVQVFLLSHFSNISYSNCICVSFRMEESFCVPLMKLQTITSPSGIGNEGNTVRRSQRLRYSVTVINCSCYNLLTLTHSLTILLTVKISAQFLFSCWSTGTFTPYFSHTFTLLWNVCFCCLLHILTNTLVIISL